MKIVTRADAFSAGLKKFYTGTPCRHGHYSERYTSTSGCIECLRPGSGRTSNTLNRAWPVEPFVFESKITPTPAEAQAAFMLMQAWGWPDRALDMLRADPNLAPAELAEALAADAARFPEHLRKL